MDGVLRHLYNNLFTCKICNEKFSSKHLLIEHETTHTGKELLQDHSDELCTIPKKMDGVFKLLYNNLFTCKICGDRFSSQIQLVEHKAVHIGQSLPPGSGNETEKHSPGGMDGVMSMLYNNLFECKLCNEKFSSNAQLIEHEKIHAGGSTQHIMVKQEPEVDENVDAQRVEGGMDNMLKMLYNNLFHCSTCNERFASKTQLAEHEMVHACVSISHKKSKENVTGDDSAIDDAMNLLYNNLFKCSYCNENFSSNDHLIEHERLHANGTIPPEFRVKTEPVGNDYEGDTGQNKNADGDKNYEERNAEARVQERMEGVFRLLYNNLFPCKICNEKFSTKELLVKHEMMVHSDGNSIQQDHEALFKEGEKSGLEKINEKEGNSEVKMDKETQEKIDEHIQEKMDGVMRLLYNNLFQCKICHERFSSKPHLTLHEMTHAGTSSMQDNGDPQPSSEDPLKPKKVLEKNYKCDICGHAFTQKYKLIRHYRVHTGERPYKCDLCGAAFSQKSVLVNHERLHTGEKPYSCELCGATFSVKGYLIKHHRTHTGEKPFKCDKCDSVFGDRGNLSKHKKIHTGEKPYKCGTCTAAFSDRSTLMKHQRIHTDDKQYKCEHCNASFNMKSALTTHKKVHLSDEQHKCDVCDAEFSARGYLIRHLRTHTGEKQYIPSFLMPPGEYNAASTSMKYEKDMEDEDSQDKTSMEQEEHFGTETKKDDKEGT